MLLLANKVENSIISQVLILFAVQHKHSQTQKMKEGAFGQEKSASQGEGFRRTTIHYSQTFGGGFGVFAITP
jgi:hypothetical protein